jgi:hypothetical protein
VFLCVWPGGHGKTGVIDGAIFGFLGVTGAILWAIKKWRMRTTAQLAQVIKLFREDQMRADLVRPSYREASKSNKAIWIVTIWTPSKHPTKLMYFKQKAIHSYFAWSSRPLASSARTFGIVPVEVRIHSVTKRGESTILKQDVHYELEERKLAEVDRHWNVAPADVEDSATTNADAWEEKAGTEEQFRELCSFALMPHHSQLSMTAYTAKKDKTDQKQKTCVVQWVLDPKDLSRTTVKSLQAELKRHSLSGPSTLLELRDRIRKHAKVPHPKATKTTASNTITGMFGWHAKEVKAKQAKGKEEKAAP